MNGEQRLMVEALLQNMADGVIAIDKEGRTIVFNRAAAKITQFSMREALGRPFEEIFACQTGRGENPLKKALETGEVQMDHSADLISRTGERIPLSVTCSPFLSEYDEVVGGLAVFRDMTEFREIDNMKTEFISTVSHELRTPLTSIKGAIGLIMGGVAGEINEEVRELLNIAQKNTDRLIKIINDMLDISKIESGKIQMNKEPLYITDCVRRSVEGISAFAHQNNIRIETDLPPATSVILADKDRIDQVITNLLSNAIKFTPAGGQVTVSVREEDDFVKVSVKDTGIGVPETHLERIFDKFHQVDRTAARQKGGTGLGLSICYAIVNEHGGKIWAESIVGKGSTFSFTLPRLKGGEELAEPELTLSARVQEFESRRLKREPLEIKGKTILVCDDDPYAVRELKRFLDKEGFECIEAYNGRECIELARRVRPDAISLDIIMPGLDGFQVVNILKQDPVTERIPVVFVSILRDKAHKEVSLGVHDWLVKPISEKRLVDSVKRAVGQAAERPVILIVDDDKDTVKLLRVMIEKAGYIADTAYDGKEAIEKINAMRPDLIILDIMMPGLDGFQVVSLLKENNWTRHIPILVLTAKDLTPLEKRLLHLGVTRFLTKSYATEEKIMADVSQLIHLALNH